MSPYLLPPSEDGRDKLLAALRRHDQAGSLEVLAKLSGELPPPSDLVAWARSHHPGEHRVHQPDTEWLLRETAQHIADSRFEHALCLVERYSGCHLPEGIPDWPPIVKFRQGGPA